MGPTAQELGTGFVVRDEDGSELIVTSHHVVWGASEIRVETSAGTILPVDLVGSDPATDLAVLRIRAGVTIAGCLAFEDDRAMQVGDWVGTIGNPGGVIGAASVGIVSARGRVPYPTVAAEDIVDYLFTDNVVAAGSSGGPVFALDGRVVGVIVATAGQSGGLAVVMPAGLASEVTRGLARGGSYRHSSSGIRLARGAADTGTRVAYCEGECLKAGLEVGDFLVTVNGQRPDEGGGLGKREFMTQPGSRWKVDYVRAGERRSTFVELREFGQEAFVGRSSRDTVLNLAR